MKKILLGIVAVGAIALTGCDEASRLAGDVSGAWSSTPQMLVNDPGSQATIVETIEFQRDSTSNGGVVIVSGLISSTGSTSGNEALMQPFEIAASARSTISGTWKAIDDDDITMALDVQSLNVEIDPTALVITSNVLTGDTESNPENVKPQIAQMVRAAIQRQLTARYTSWTKLDDVKVKDKGTVLKFEVGKKDYVYHNQAQKTN